MRPKFLGTDVSGLISDLIGVKLANQQLATSFYKERKYPPRPERFNVLIFLVTQYIMRL